MLKLLGCYHQKQSPWGLPKLSSLTWQAIQAQEIWSRAVPWTTSGPFCASTGSVAIAAMAPSATSRTARPSSVGPKPRMPTQRTRNCAKLWMEKLRHQRNFSSGVNSLLHFHREGSWASKVCDQRKGMHCTSWPMNSSWRTCQLELVTSDDSTSWGLRRRRALKHPKRPPVDVYHELSRNVVRRNDWDPNLPNNLPQETCRLLLVWRMAWKERVMEWRKRCCGCKSCSWAECSALVHPVPLEHIQWPSDCFALWLWWWLIRMRRAFEKTATGICRLRWKRYAELPRSALATLHVGLKHIRSSNLIMLPVIFSLLIFLFSLPLPCSAFHLPILSEV